MFTRHNSPQFEVGNGKNFSQLRQNYLNNYFQARVGKELPKQFPEPLSVSKLDVGNFAFSNALCKPGVKNWTQTFFFSNFSGTSGISRQNPAKKFGFPGLQRTYRTFWPPPLHVEDPHPTRKYLDQKVWVWVPFSSLLQARNYLKNFPGGSVCGCAKMEPFVPLAYFPCFVVIFCEICGQSMRWRQSWSWAFPCFAGISAVFGVLEPHHLSFSTWKIHFKGKMSNFEAKRTIKQGKENANRTNGSIFAHVQGQCR